MSRNEPEDVLADWRRSGVPLEDPEIDAERRERLVPRVAAAIRADAAKRAQARSRRRFLYAFAAAATLAIGIGAWRSWSTAISPVVLPELAVEVPLGAPPRELRADEEVSTHAEPARIQVRAGAQIEVFPDSRVSLPRRQELRLAGGKVAVSVPKLLAPETFSVQTVDARVVVHGTRFVVEIAEPAPNGARTRVRVTEGRVSVFFAGRESLVSAGESWPALVARAPDPEPPPALAPSAHDAAPRHVARAAEPVKSTTSAALAEQNRLFASAVAARRRGDDSQAIVLLDQLLARHPQSPLAPEARVERFRALKRLGHGKEAAREAKRYLLEHEDGYAREEARELVLPPKKP